MQYSVTTSGNQLTLMLTWYATAMLEALLKMQETVSLDIEYYPKVWKMHSESQC